MTISLGFAVFENIGYSFAVPFVEGMQLLFFRSLLSVPAHLGLAALWGYGFSLAKFKYPQKGYASVIWPYVVVAALIHGLYDFIIFYSNGSALTGSVIFILIALFFYAFRKLNYLVSQSNFLEHGVCPACLTKNSTENKYCSHCGRSILKENIFFNRCPSCNTHILKNNKFCPQCGEKV